MLTRQGEHGLVLLPEPQSYPTCRENLSILRKGGVTSQQAWDWAVAGCSDVGEFGTPLLLIVVPFCAKAHCSGMGLILGVME